MADSAILSKLREVFGVQTDKAAYREACRRWIGSGDANADHDYSDYLGNGILHPYIIAVHKALTTTSC